jgi:hypothetical protein
MRGRGTGLRMARERAAEAHTARYRGIRGSEASEAFGLGWAAVERGAGLFYCGPDAPAFLRGAAVRRALRDCGLDRIGA